LIAPKEQKKLASGKDFSCSQECSWKFAKCFLIFNFLQFCAREEFADKTAEAALFLSENTCGARMSD